MQRVQSESARGIRQKRARVHSDLLAAVRSSGLRKPEAAARAGLVRARVYEITKSAARYWPVTIKTTERLSRLAVAVDYAGPLWAFAEPRP